MNTLGIMRQFKTKCFRVVADAVEEVSPDLSFDDTGRIRKGLESGKFILFCARVRVFYKGQEVGTDYLGNCIYKSFDDFMDHKECGKQNRKLAAKGETSRCGSYFTDMIREAIAEARKTLSEEKPYIRRLKNQK